MKKKLLVLSASAILASNFIFDNSASAVVDVRENKYESEALKLKGSKSDYEQIKLYKDSLERLIHSISVNMHAGYDEPEYKEIFDKYQKKFMAEMGALNTFVQEQKDIRKYKNNQQPVPNNLYGLTYERYLSIFESIKKNRYEFYQEAKKVEDKHEDLRRFNEFQQDEADLKINELENKILMIGNTFVRKPYAVQNMYNKLDMVISKDKYERYDMLPTNKRMLKEKSEDLETIIDEFFEEIGYPRPLEIPTLTSENQNDESIKEKLREATAKAREDERYRHERSKKRYAKFEKEKLNRAKKSSKKYEKKTSNFSYKQLKKAENVKKAESTQISQLNNQPNHGNIVNSISGNSHNKKPASIGGESKPVNIIQDSKAPSQYGSNGHLIEFSENTLSNSTGSVKQQPTFTEDTKSTKKEVITESHAVDLDEKTTHYMSGYATGYSVEDTSGYTERDKRAIRRNHVREAEELVNKYVNSHAYQDRVAAQAKVKTLSPEQQKRLNQQIDKIYNGQ
ncbi:coagulase domain-containing protein [Staphylococcus hyicus]|uniref:coagulase domain-containing protein n=1 Tax=Staphylococcus hyicus TaxID=1284 RepID=UPI0036D20CB1